jgi:hypothetical protein
MSILNFINTEDRIIICSDSLASLDCGIPKLFTTKVFSMPHLNTIIGGTGCQNTILSWFDFVELNVIAKDVRELNDGATEHIKRIYEETTKGCFPRPFTTIYHFGYDLTDARYYVYAYRSTNQFMVEIIPAGFYIKPGEEIDSEVITKHNTNKLKEIDYVALLKEICLSQQKVDKERDSTERWGIGGSVFLYVMNKDGISISKLMDFPDKIETDEIIRAKRVFK